MAEHSAFEEYCEAIFELREDDLAVIQARIADRLHVSRPAVSDMVRRMAAEGLVDISDGIHLTASGTQLAERVVRRHRLAERFLTDVLGLSWSEAHTEAGRWEHVLTDTVEAAMNRLLGDPTTCPHGNPIPRIRLRGPRHRRPHRRARRHRVRRHPHPRGARVHRGGARVPGRRFPAPGTQGVVTAASPDGTVTVHIDDRHVGIGAFASARILVLAGAATGAGVDAVPV